MIAGARAVLDGACEVGVDILAAVAGVDEVVAEDAGRVGDGAGDALGARLWVRLVGHGGGLGGRCMPSSGEPNR